MGLEDKFCTYCGSPNLQAVRHQADMEHFQKEYQRTQQDVMEKTGRLRRYGSWLTILVVLLIAMIAGVILLVSAWDIGYRIREKKTAEAMPAHKAVLDQYLAEGEYGKFLGFYSANDLYTGDTNEYQAVYYAARGYTDIISTIYAIGDENDFRFRDKYRTESCEYLAQDLIRIWTAEKEMSYWEDEALTEDKLAYLEDIRDRTAQIAKTYFGLTDEEIARIPELSEAKLGEMIERGIAS